jgi:hypothetical protein
MFQIFKSHPLRVRVACFLISCVLVHSYSFVDSHLFPKQKDTEDTEDTEAHTMRGQSDIFVTMIIQSFSTAGRYYSLLPLFLYI